MTLAKKKTSKSTDSAVVIEPPRVVADPETPTLSRALLERLLWVNSERKALDAKARKLATEEAQLRDVAFAWLEEREKTTHKAFGIRVSQVEGNVYPPWKNAFIQQLGVEAADKLTEDSPRSVQLKIARE